jgi:hypothetical protein
VDIPEEFKFWRQNLGHGDVLTTLYSYGHVQQDRQSELLINQPNLSIMNTSKQIKDLI